MSNATSWPAPDPHPPSHPRDLEAAGPLGRRALARRRVGALPGLERRVRSTQRACRRSAAARGDEFLPALGPVADHDHVGAGAHLTDVDGNRLLDLSMGFGAMLVGHLNPVVVDAVKHALDEIGTLFVTPSSQATDMAERFKTRFGLDMLRFTNSGTESPCMRSVRPAPSPGQGDHQDRRRLSRRLRPCRFGETRARRDRPG